MIAAKYILKKSQKIPSARDSWIFRFQMYMKRTMRWVNVVNVANFKSIYRVLRQSAQPLNMYVALIYMMFTFIARYAAAQYS